MQNIKNKKISIAASRSDKVFYFLDTLLLTIVLISAIYPLYYVLLASVSDYKAVGRGEVLFWPVGFNIESYMKVFQRESIVTGYRNTLFYTVFGTTLNLILTLTSAYALSVKFPGRRLINFMITFTMFFSGGIIPTYFLYRDMKLLNTIWVMILPGAISAYNLIIARSFMRSNISIELYEAAEIDGCSHFRFFIYIALPLSKVLVSILTLFYAVGHWNSYFNAMMYLDDSSMYPLQLVAREILISGNISAMDMIDKDDLMRSEQLRESLKYALIVVASLPVLILYPFLQKYFVKGIMIGSVKG